MAKVTGISGYSEAQETNFNAVTERLPIGGYVLKINQVRLESYDWGAVIVMAFDIAEGEQKGFFKKQYDGMLEEYKKWKGTYRLTIPQQKSNSQDDMDKYHRQLGFFKSQIEAFNKSNNCKIDPSSEWDIDVLKGKLVGAVFGNAEWYIDGRSGWYTACDHLLPVQDIRSGDFKIPKDKPARNKPKDAPAAVPVGGTDDFEEVLSDEEVPF